MGRYIRLLCMVMAIAVLMSSAPVCAYATDGEENAMNSSSSSMSHGARNETGEPAEDVPAAVAETEPPETEAETQPGTEPEETAPEAEEESQPAQLEEEPAETEPAQPEETQPEETQPAATQWVPAGTNGVPLYFQNDYPETLYGAGTVETSGCSITALAMVGTYLTGHEYLPDELARYFGGRAENNMARMELGAQKMQLPYEKNCNWHVTLQALKEGKIVIALMEHTSIFTDSQHFIVLTGMTADGKILVNDPYRPNYDRWDLKAGFANGFTEGEICRGYSGGWVFDKSRMPEEPFIYEEAPPPYVEPRYPGIKLTKEEWDLLARVVWVEARGESFEGQQAVAEVVFNRMISGDFPNTVVEVIYGEGQFRSVPFLDKAEPNQTQYEAVQRALYGPYVLPVDVYYFARTATNDNVWGSIGGHIFCYQW